MKVSINACLFHVMIPLVFCYDQTEAKRVVFNKPAIITTDLGSQDLIQLEIPRDFLLIVLLCAKFLKF